MKQVFNQSSCCCIAFQRSTLFTLISLHRFNKASAYGRQASLLRPFIAFLPMLQSDIDQASNTINRKIKQLSKIYHICTQKLIGFVSHSLVGEREK